MIIMVIMVIAKKTSKRCAGSPIFARLIEPLSARH